MSLKLWYVSGQFYNLAMVLFTFVQNIGNLPKFNFQTGNLARGAGIIWTRWKSRTFVNVGGSRICSQGACSGNDGGSLIWECTWRHLARRMLAGPCLLYGALMGGVRGGEFSTLFSTLVRPPACSFGHDTTKPRWKDLQKASHAQGWGGLYGLRVWTIGAKDATNLMSWRQVRRSNKSERENWPQSAWGRHFRNRRFQNLGIAKMSISRYCTSIYRHCPIILRH